MWRLQRKTDEAKNVLPTIAGIKYEKNGEGRMLIDSIKEAPKNNLKENKPQPSLIPMDLLLQALEPAYREGLLKYSRESWREGFKYSTMYDSAIRHLSDFYFKEEDFDPDAAELGIIKMHLGGALFSILCMVDTFLNHPEKDDRRQKRIEREKERAESITMGPLL